MSGICILGFPPNSMERFPEMTPGAVPTGQTLTMSSKERERLKVLNRLAKGEVTCADAAESLGITERHLYRVCVRYKADGDEGLIHRLRGCLSNHGYTRKVRT